MLINKYISNRKTNGVFIVTKKLYITQKIIWDAKLEIQLSVLLGSRRSIGRTYHDPVWNPYM